MIQINLQDTKTLNFNRAIAKTINAIRSRSFFGRNPQIGRMVNCAVCGRRHRDNLACKLIYITEAANIRRGIQGARTFAKKRFHPHPNKYGLQLIQMVRALFPTYHMYLPNPQEAMESARKDARRILIKKQRAFRKLKQKQQDIARRINAGLERPGARALAPIPRMKKR